jgi:hypothetical protein
MTRKLLIAGLIIFLVLLFATVTLPARIAWQLLQHRVPSVQLLGLHGTLWAGNADSVLVANQALGKLTWQIPYSSVFRFTPRAQLKLDGATVQLDGMAQRSGSNWVMSALTASADASWLAPALGIPAVIPTGKLAGNFSELSLDQRGVPKHARGNVQWLAAGVTGLAQADFGSYDVAIKSDVSGAITGSISAIGSVALDISGGFVLQGENYKAQITLRQQLANPNVERALALIGEPIAGVPGARLLKIHGTLVIPK